MATAAQVRVWLTIISVAGATILPTYINGALTIALPTIGSQMGVDEKDLQWPVTVFSLVNGAFLLVAGGLADSFGRRLVFVAGTAWLPVFTIPLAFCKDSTAFIALCAILGLGPAMLAPAGTGILSESLPDGKIKNAAFAALGAGQPVGYIIGLLFGGVFAKTHAVIFLVAAAAAVAFGAMALFCLPKDGEKLVPESATSGTSNIRRGAPLLAFDWVGAALSLIGIVLFNLALALAGTSHRGWGAVTVLSLLPISAAMLAAFLYWERLIQRQSSSSSVARLRKPLIPPGIWFAPSFSAILAIVFLVWMGFNALTYYCTLLYQVVQHTAPLQTSIRFLPMIGSGLLLNIIGGIAVGRVDALHLIIAGSLCTATSCAIFALQNPAWSYARAMLTAMLLLPGPDIFFPAVQIFACKTVGPRRAALAGSLFNITTRLATSIGLAICTSIQAAATKGSVMSGYRGVGWFCFSTSALAILVALATLRKVGIVGRMPEGEVEQDEASGRDSIELPSLSNGLAVNGDGRGNGHGYGHANGHGAESVDSKR